MSKKNGNEELLYVATTAPTDATDKDDAAYALVSNLKTFSLSGESDEVDGGDKDTGSFGDPFPGRKNITSEFTWNRDFAAATGQGRLETAYLATTAANQLLYFLKTTNVAGDEGRHFQARVLNFGLSSDDQAIGEGNCTARLVGAYTKFVES